MSLNLSSVYAAQESKSKNTKVVTKRWKPIKNPQAERKERLFTHETQKHAMYILIYIKGKAY